MMQHFWLAMVACFVVLAAGWAAAQSKPENAYVGSAACAGCHAEQSGKWADSDHAWAWRIPTRESVKADFAGETISKDDETTKFLRDGDKFVAEVTQGGEKRVFDIKGTAGIEPLQQYLVEIEPGRLQALDFSWDTEKQSWFHLYPELHEKFGDGLHWTGPYKNWNGRCAECHATAYKKNYDAHAKHFDSTQSELGVGCEACHGPGAAHLAWARDKDSFDAKAFPGLSDRGLSVTFAGSSPETEIQQCAGCHSRREPLEDGNPAPGTPFHQAYRLALLTPGLYHPDGSIQDEVYVYGSFLQSKMYAKGVRCSDCHNPHSGALKASDNGLCTQCHSPSGNPRFPTLTKTEYDTPDHHFHAVGTAGAQCKSCHMIERVYMRVDGRRDHSFRIPRPDLSTATGSPNACSDCHADRTPEWAAQELAKRFPNSTHRGHHFSDVFAKARQQPETQIAQLLEIARDAGKAAIVRATALDLLKAVTDPSVAASALGLIGDESPLVRAAAIELQRGAADADRVNRLVPTLTDPMRSVRIAAARTLIGTPRAGMKADTAELVSAANREWQSSLAVRADFPETHLVLGGIALTMRNLRAASGAFEEAVRQDPQLVPAWVMLVRIALATGNGQGARETLARALKSNPGNLELQRLSDQAP